MSFYRDRHIMHYCFFLAALTLLTFGIGIFFVAAQASNVKRMYLAHSEAITSSLLEQGVPAEIIAAAVAQHSSSKSGAALLNELGLTDQTANNFLPFVSQFQRETACTVFTIILIMALLLFAGSLIFLERREHLYRQADTVIRNYINGDFRKRLPQNNEGTLYQIFSSVEQLATILQSRNESAYRTKDFLKNAIADISHQLKTPLTALAMYQQIIAEEPHNAVIVSDYAKKTGAALERMEQLIQSMLKITRLDTGNIIFEMHRYHVSEVVLCALSELTTRAKIEGKEILTDGDAGQQITCDIAWTGEAVGNIVKNALDHTNSGDTIRIKWEASPTMLRIFISDNGSGIDPEDIHHIFKRFYRSKHSLDTQGIGLGLPLAKSIVEGQGGVVSVKSHLGEGTEFVLAFELR